jgi:hypothetical protein
MSKGDQRISRLESRKTSKGSYTTRDDIYSLGIIMEELFIVNNKR